MLNATYQEQREQEDEDYAHLIFSINNLNDAHKILLDIKNEMVKSEKNSLIVPAFKFALIEYAKPYKKSRSTVKKKGYVLDEKYIPDDCRVLHKRIIYSRDKINAHTDLTVREPIVYKGGSKSDPIIGIISNVVDGAKELPNIDEIITLIKRTLDKMRDEIKRREKEFKRKREFEIEEFD